jgi:hypothetical protein
MPARTITIDGDDWTVQPSGFTTQFVADEFGLLFMRAGSDASEMRVTRYSPTGTRSRDDAFMAISEARLRALFRASQPTLRSPEGGYRA